MSRKKSDVQTLLDAANANPTGPERAKVTRMAKLEKRIAKAMSGGSYHGKEIHEAFPNPETLRKQINAYFEVCELKKKPLTVPGLALAIGVRTSALMAYSPIDPKWSGHRKLIEFAVQRIESWMADSLCTGTGSTKGREFLAQNTLNYANKSQVNSTGTLEISDKDRVRGMSDDELREQAKANIDKINAILPNVRPFKAAQ